MTFRALKTAVFKAKKPPFASHCVSSVWKGEKYKAYILKYKAHILKYMACIFHNKPCVFFRGTFMKRILPLLCLQKTYIRRQRLIFRLKKHKKNFAD